MDVKNNQLKHAKIPIDWYIFQKHLSDLGYEMVFEVPNEKSILFRLKKTTDNSKLKETITILRPTLYASDGETPAYERDYVVDLLIQILGGDTGDALAILKAKRDIH